MAGKRRPNFLDWWYNERREVFLIQRLPQAPAWGSIDASSTVWRASIPDAPPQAGDSESFEAVSESSIRSFLDAAADAYRQDILAEVQETGPGALRDLYEDLLEDECGIAWDDLPKAGYNGRVSTQDLREESENQRDRAWWAMSKELELGFAPGSLTYDAQPGAAAQRPGLEVTLLRALVGHVDAIFLSTLDRLRRHRHGPLTLDLCYAVTGNVFFEPMGSEDEYMEYIPDDRTSARRSLSDLTQAFVENLDSSRRKLRGIRSKMKRTKQTTFSVRSRLFFTAK